MSRAKRNTIIIEIEIDQDNETLDFDVEHNLSVTMTEEQQAYYLNIVNGLNSKLRSEIDTFAKEGYFIREINSLRTIAEQLIEDDYEEEEPNGFTIEFEPDEELVDAVSEQKNGHKILKFNGKKIH
jgi:hypothetical protein|tara:strand:+ start:224 stop:601 length:378 start_codon:yes stop_codon:yes gene_type:complete